MIYLYCQTCKHYVGDKACFAYPDGIPDKIFSGDELHDEPRKGDHGIQYEPIKE